MARSPFSAPVPRVPRSRRDDRYDAGHPTPQKRPSSGYVVSVQDAYDTVTVDVLDEELTGVIPLGEMPPVDAICEVESRGDLLVIPLWFAGPPSGPYAFISGTDPYFGSDPTWDAAVIPTLSDSSDSTFIHYDSMLPDDHLDLLLIGDPTMIPADSSTVTGITFTIRARTITSDNAPIPVSYWFNLADPDLTEGMQFYNYTDAYDPAGEAMGLVIPDTSGFSGTSVTLDQAGIDNSLDDSLTWAFTAGTGWATLADFVDYLRSSGGFAVYLSHNFTGAWDLAQADLTFDTA